MLVYDIKCRDDRVVRCVAADHDTWVQIPISAFLPELIHFKKL